MTLKKIVALTLVALAAVMAPAQSAHGARANVDISLNSVTVASASGLTTVTLSVTNNSDIRVNIETNVMSLLCDFAACDLDSTTNQCTVAETGGGEGSLDAGQTADFTVVLALDAGNYLFTAKAVGNKGSSEDRKQSVVAAVVP